MIELFAKIILFHKINVNGNTVWIIFNKFHIFIKMIGINPLSNNHLLKLNKINKIKDISYRWEDSIKNKFMDNIED